MNTYYSRWMEQEEAWAAEIDAGRKKKAWIYAAIAFVLCVAAVSGIGFLAAGVETGINNIKYGVILGVVSVGFYLIAMLCISYKKHYMKSLKKEANKELTTDALKEEFAMAMLDTATKNSPCLEFVWRKGEVPQRFCVVSRFAVIRGAIPCIVQLDKIERMELDVVEFKNTSSVGDYKVRTSLTTYPIYFYYQQSQIPDRKKQKADKLISFPSREMREQAIRMMQEKMEDNGTAQ